MAKRFLIAIVGVTLVASASAAPMFSSADREKGLLEGKGMGLATPAENHGYPGPRHVLDAAAMLNLTPDQKSRTAALVDAMKAEAIPAAKRLLGRVSVWQLRVAERGLTAGCGRDVDG